MTWKRGGDEEIIKTGAWVVKVFMSAVNEKWESP